MSIFPKRTLRGKGVTIHWGLNFTHTANNLRYAFIRIQVKTPSKKVVNLCEDYIQLLPNLCNTKNENGEEGDKFLSKGTPLLLLADFLSGGRHKKQKLVELFKRINEARHFYFYYEIPENAELGRYDIVSEFYVDGKCYKSSTIEEDFFYVESIELNDIREVMDEFHFSVKNNSSESCPIKMMEYDNNNKVEINITSLLPNEKRHLKCRKGSYILYNEEREMLTLEPKDRKRPLRNPETFHFEKEEKEEKPKAYLILSNDEAFTLEGKSKSIWEMSNGINYREEVKRIDEKMYNKMIENRLIIEL